jgi:hypothetical protein
MKGIVTMPSYHTVMAVLLAYAFPGTGLIGYGIAALNVVMLLSISPIGGHYLAIALQRTMATLPLRRLAGLSSRPLSVAHELARAALSGPSPRPASARRTVEGGQTD